MNSKINLPAISNLNNCNQDSIEFIAETFNATVLDGGLGRCKEIDQMIYNKIMDSHGLSSIRDLYTNKQEWFVNETTLFYLNPYVGAFDFPFDSHIISVGKDDSYGINIKLVSDSGVKFRFAILSSAKVKEGQSIKAGDLIGTVGAPKGDMSKSHVHVEVWKGQPTLNGKETAMKSMDPFLLDGLVLADKLYMTDGSAFISNKVS